MRIETLQTFDQSDVKTKREKVDRKTKIKKRVNNSIQYFIVQYSTVYSTVAVGSVARLSSLSL